MCTLRMHLVRSSDKLQTQPFRSGCKEAWHTYIIQYVCKQAPLLCIHVQTRSLQFSRHVSETFLRAADDIAESSATAAAHGRLAVAQQSGLHLESLTTQGHLQEVHFQESTIEHDQQW